MKSEEGKRLLETYYRINDEETITDIVHRAAYSYGSRPVVAAFIEDAIHKGWFMPASPVISNAGTSRGYSISCFVNHVPDTRAGIVEHNDETWWMSMYGGGVGGNWSAVRGVGSPIKGGGSSPGIMPFLKVADAGMGAFHQGSTRRGNYAAYLDVSHPEIIEFLGMRIPHGGDQRRKCTDIHHGISISDAFMEAVESGGTWDLIDPSSEKVTDTVDARDLFRRIVETRYKTGEPYIVQLDEANRHLPKSLKENGLKIRNSNLCTEIFLPTGDDHSNVCCLSSLNLETFDEWEDTPLVEYAIEYLDDVLSDFIHDAKHRVLHKAAAQAEYERSIGLGTMGFHSYLQSKMLPMDSLAAKYANERIFKKIKKKALAATQQLAEERGEPDGMKGTGRRNAHLLAVAPNSNSSIMLDTSPSIEPWKAPAFTRRNRVGNTPVRNRYLHDWLVEAHGEELAEDVWNKVVADGSVMNVPDDLIPEDIKDVFKSAAEIDQHVLVSLANDRQKFICQGQSLNLFFPEGADASYVTSVHYQAFKKGSNIKSVYYLKTESNVKAENVKQTIGEECISCQG